MLLIVLMMLLCYVLIYYCHILCKHGTISRADVIFIKDTCFTQVTAFNIVTITSNNTYHFINISPSEVIFMTPFVALWAFIIAHIVWILRSFNGNGYISKMYEHIGWILVIMTVAYYMGLGLLHISSTCIEYLNFLSLFNDCGLCSPYGLITTTVCDKYLFTVDDFYLCAGVIVARGATILPDHKVISTIL